MYTVVKVVGTEKAMTDPPKIVAVVLEAAKWGTYEPVRVVLPIDLITDIIKLGK